MISGKVLLWHLVCLTFASASLASASELGECATKNMVETRVLEKAPMMMQLNLHSSSQQRFQQRATSHDSQVATSMRTHLENPTNIASSLRCGLQAIFASIVHFSAEEPRIREGVSKLGEKLFTCVTDLVSADASGGLGDLVPIRRLWQGIFDDLEGSSESVFSDIARFVRDGETQPLLRAIGSIFGEASTMVSSVLPGEASVQIARYLGAVEDAFESVGASWDEFAKGNTIDGVAAVYAGLRRTTAGLLPASLKNDATISAVVGSLDVVVGDLSKTVLEYERRIMESNVCWRAEKSRERERPQLCPSGYHWDGRAFCYPTIGLLENAAVSKSLDSSVQQKGGGYSPQLGAIPARCDMNGAFPEKHGQFCYSSCGAGYHAKSHSRCVSSCEGRFPAEGLLMCGRDPGILMKNILDMATHALNALLTVAESFRKLGERGIDARSLASTVQTFVELGTPFANPVCPAPDAVPTPRPTPRPTAAEENPGSQRKSKTKCRLGEHVFFISHRGEQLQDNHGHLRFSKNRQEWEQWTLSDAGDGRFFITSHRGQSIIDREGRVGLSQEWEMWKIIDAGGGLMFLSSHRKQQLQDWYGEAKLVWNAHGWEKWRIVDANGKPACRTVNDEIES
eukprot:TRINITY_DN63842_c0_g1_i1.p1 TRINITY_DN63842_c0_g1~~TRINITY_DN63842_c0_g1_i1.p1  ORF type:complete len:647 (+),score=91.34 TRINITY_DN63842_c0_g1_i1:69-1943(+)